MQITIKTVNEFKFTVVHVGHPNPMQICGCEGFSAGQKTVENQDWAAGRRATGPSRAVRRGPRACF